jgi:tetratricopeptide (TPR) repeat protein
MKSLLLFAALVGPQSTDLDSPAEQKIASARRWIEKDPSSYAAQNALALALTRRARETADASYYRQAEEALEASFRISPDNFEAARLKVWALLGKHEFARALEEAKALKARMPDDLLTYAFLADAHVELGNYAEAEEAAQWLLDLRPGNVAGLTRGAYLRELFGDVDGALEWMLMAHDQTHFNESEDRAWILTHMAHLEWSRGRLDASEEHLMQALELFPEYHYALGELAKVRRAQKRLDEAVSLLRLRYEKAPHPENLYELAEALSAAGETEEANGLFAKFEEKARAESDRFDNANRELLFFYADHASRPEEALAIGEREIGRRHDVFTRDAYAWALHRNGRSADALKEIAAALEVGIRDARMLYHAGAISAALGDRQAAARYFQESLTLNPHSPVAEKARESLAGIESEVAP